MPSIIANPLPHGLRQTVIADALAGPRPVPLTEREVQALTAIVRDRTVNAPLSRHHAITALAAAATPEAVLPVLDEVARNESAGRTDRVAAIHGLGRIGTEAAQRLLLDRVADVDPRVQQAAFAALGHFADPSALAALEGVTATDAASQQQLALTRALVSYRHGIAGSLLAGASRRQRPDRLAENAPAIVLELKSVQATASDVSRFRGSYYGIQLADQGYGLRCGRAEWTVFVNRELGSLGAAEKLLRRHWIAALVARWLPPDIAVSTQYIVLSRPDGASLRFDVVRADGEVVYTGSGDAAGPSVSFDIFNVDRPAAAPTLLKGRFDGVNVELEAARVSDTRPAPRRVLPTKGG